MFSLLALAHRIVLEPSFEDRVPHYIFPKVILRLGANARATAFNPAD